MAFGLGVLRLAPAAFWAMTPRELAAAADGTSGGRTEPPRRTALEALMRRYPDGAAPPLPPDRSETRDGSHGR
jgi:uncharacterized phage protein (TIGR02216 family)